MVGNKRPNTMAPPSNVPMREIVYQLSPYQQDVIMQTFKNAPHTFWVTLKRLGPRYAFVYGVYWGATTWTNNELEKEKLAARF